MEERREATGAVKQVRDGRTEVYRCLLMLMVVVHHIVVTDRMPHRGQRGGFIG